MKIIDISRTLDANIAPWPGDKPFVFSQTGTIEGGWSVNLGAISMSLHNGTHADAAFHFDNGGARIDGMQLAAYVGRAVVVDLGAKFLEENNTRTISVVDLEAHADAIAETKRLLVRTNVWSDSATFPKWIPVIESNVAQFLRKLDIVLIGFDVPSVDELDSKKLPNHHALGAANIAIVESLDLSAVAAGVYNFAALPLKIAGGDGAPVRAVLWT